MTIKFPVHGSSKVSVDNNLIIIECEGPWNIEFFYELHQDILNAVKAVDYNNYGVLLIPRGEAIGTAETTNYHIAFLKEGNTKAIAINIALSDIPASTENICRIAYQAAGLKHAFFNDNDTAIDWLQQQLD